VASYRVVKVNHSSFRNGLRG